MDEDDDKEYRATKTWSVEELQMLWDLKTKDRKSCFLLLVLRSFTYSVYVLVARFFVCVYWCWWHYRWQFAVMRK